MRVGINLLYLIPGVVGGTETYALGLLYGLAKINDQDNFIIFLNQESKNLPIPKTKNFTKVVCPIFASNRAKRYFYEQLILPKLIHKYDINILHSLGYVSPLYCSCKSILTIPDVNFIAIRNMFPYLKRLMLSFFSTRSARNCDHIITISNFSKNEIVRLLKINPNKITVTYLGPRINHINNNVNKWAEIEKKYQIKKPYIVAFGGRALHKNIPRLIKAFNLIKHKINHSLLLIGHIPENVDLLSKEVSDNPRSRIIITGYVPEEYLLPLLKNSDLFVLPSLYEGFGLPILEAQQAGIPVLCSKAGSIPEVGGSGALYFDPININNMADKMFKTLEDMKIQEELLKNGEANLDRYSWEKTAKETLLTYRELNNRT